jgi:hypothetical protein
MLYDEEAALSRASLEQILPALTLLLRPFAPYMAEEMWGLNADEVKGTAFFNLDIGLEVGKLRQAVRACQVSGTNDDLLFDAINRRGRSIRCRITVTKQRILEEKNRGSDPALRRGQWTG